MQVSLGAKEAFAPRCFGQKFESKMTLGPRYTDQTSQSDEILHFLHSMSGRRAACTPPTPTVIWDIWHLWMCWARVEVSHFNKSKDESWQIGFDKNDEKQIQIPIRLLRSLVLRTNKRTTTSSDRLHPTPHHTLAQRHSADFSWEAIVCLGAVVKPGEYFRLLFGICMCALCCVV